MKIFQQSPEKVDKKVTKGYNRNDIIQVTASFTDNRMDFTFRHLNGTDSTNLEAKRAALEGAPEGLCVIADSQSAGMGRLGRSFFSPKTTGLYMSLLLRPRVMPEPQIITCAAAAAVCSALEKRGFSPGIKWVNDILIAQKKVCGILTQGFFGNGCGFAVLGIGVNLFEPEGGFPKELKTIAGALYKDQSKAGPDLRDRLARDILAAFAELYEDRPETVADEYAKRSLMPGKRITVTLPGSVFDATALGIESDLSLKIRTDLGETLLLNSGDVTLKLK